MKMLVDCLHILPYLFLSRDDVRDIGKHDFLSVLFSSTSSSRPSKSWQRAIIIGLRGTGTRKTKWHLNDFTLDLAYFERCFNL